MVRARGRLCGGVSVGRARLAGNIGPILAECYNDLVSNVELFRDTPLDYICCVGVKSKLWSIVPNEQILQFHNML